MRQFKHVKRYRKQATYCIIVDPVFGIVTFTDEATRPSVRWICPLCTSDTEHAVATVQKQCLAMCGRFGDGTILLTANRFKMRGTREDCRRSRTALLDLTFAIFH